MATTIITKNGTGAPLASDLVAGELAVDLTNKRLYTEDSGGTIIEVGTNPSGAVTFNSNSTFSGATAAQFRDSALKVSSSVDGQLDIDADVELEITAPTVDIDASTAVTIDTATLTVTGAANVTGDLDVDNININGNAIISTNTNGNIDLTPNGTGEVNISKVDIDAGAIDGTTVGATSASTGAFTTLTASTSLNIASTTTVDGVLDEDTMTSNSATKLATQQSIKAYVDSQVGANNELSEVLANGNTTGANNIVVTAGQSITTDSILETTAAAGVDIDGVLLKDTSVGTDAASGTNIAGTAVTVKGGQGTGTGAGGSLVFQTAPAGLTGSTPNAQVTALTIDSAGDATFTGASANMSWDKSANSLAFADNAKAVFGAGSDLQIYHDSNNSYIVDSGDGNLYINANEFRVGNADNSKDYIHGNNGAEVKLYHNNSVRLTTTSTGIDVTGDITLGDTNPTITFNDSSVTNLSHTISSASDNLRIMADANGVDAGSRVEIFDGITEVARFEAGAVDVTGTVTADGLTVDGTTLFLDGTFTTGSTPTITLGDSSTYFKVPYGSNAAIGGYTGIDIFGTASGNKIATFANGGDISFYEDTGTTAKLFWDASAESLGIGTSSPDHLLHIEASNDSALRLTRTGVRSFRQYINSTGKFIIRDLSGTPADRLTIDTSGNVGIGTSSPDTRLDLGSVAASTQTAILARNSGGDTNFRLVAGTDSGTASNTSFFEMGIAYDAGTYQPNSMLKFFRGGGTTGGFLAFTTNNDTERMRIDSSGNIGIGTSSPQSSQKLHIANTSGNCEMTLQSSDSGVASLLFGDATDFSRGKVTYDNSSDSMAFQVNNLQEAMRIDSSGNLLVGCTSLPSSSVKGFGVEATSTGARIKTSTNTTAADSHHLFFNPNGTVGSIQTSASSTSYNTSSDQRLKDNIVDAPSASDDIDAIQVRSFDWKADGSHQKYGMVAQELQSVAPDAVTGDANSDDMMGVDYSKLVPMLVKEIQSLRARVAQLEGEN